MGYDKDSFGGHNYSVRTGHAKIHGPFQKKCPFCDGYYDPDRESEHRHVRYKPPARKRRHTRPQQGKKRQTRPRRLEVVVRGPTGKIVRRVKLNCRARPTLPVHPVKVKMKVSQSLLTPCDYCGAPLKEGNRKSHVALRCPKAPPDVIAGRLHVSPRPKPIKQRGRAQFPRRVVGSSGGVGSIDGGEHKHVYTGCPDVIEMERGFTRCRFCGRPAMAGSDLCYTCESD
jgi:hypothetical protein